MYGNSRVNPLVWQLKWGRSIGGLFNQSLVSFGVHSRLALVLPCCEAGSMNKIDDVGSTRGRDDVDRLGHVILPSFAYMHFAHLWLYPYVRRRTDLFCSYEADFFLLLLGSATGAGRAFGFTTTALGGV